MYQATIQDCIAALETLDPERALPFPVYVCSWRGIYAELALVCAENRGAVTVAGLIANLRSAIGQTFQGYKGGDYEMNEWTYVHLVAWSSDSDASPECAPLLGLFADGFANVGKKIKDAIDSAKDQSHD